MPRNERAVILLADDDPDDRELFLIHLRRSGRPIDVVTASDGDEAFARLKDGKAPRPSLVVADIEMPRGTGLELLAKVKDDGELAKIPFALLTSSNSSGNRKEAARLGADLYLEKPSSVAGYDEVVARLGGLLEEG